MKVHTYDDTGIISFTFDGDTPDVVFDANKVHYDLCIHAMMFGLTNRIKDTAAIARKDAPDGNVTESMRRAKVVEMSEHLEAGGTEWNLKATGRKAPQNAAILALAAKLTEKRGVQVTYEEAEAHIQEMILQDLS